MCRCTVHVSRSAERLITLVLCNLQKHIMTSAYAKAVTSQCVTSHASQCFAIVCSGLHFVAAAGNANCTQMLCEAGADVDRPDKDGMTLVGSHTSAS